jgi:glycogen operon protein
MLLAGDEFGRTQQGNNNAYCQDNEINWFDWEGMSEEGRALLAFTRKLIALRHAFPVLRRARFLTGEVDEEVGVKDATWLTPAGSEMTQENWADSHARCMGVLLDGRPRATGLRRAAHDATMLLVVNSYHDVVAFKLPEVVGGARWELVIDTNLPERDELSPFEFGHDYMVTGRSFLLFALKPEEPKGIIRLAEQTLRTVAETPVTIPAEPEREPEPEEALEQVGE